VDLTVVHRRVHHRAGSCARASTHSVHSRVI
jgi:hypothetical protein